MDWNWVDVLVALGTLVAAVAALLALALSARANWIAHEAVVVARDQESGQRERRDKLRRGLDQYSSRLSELNSRLTPNWINTARSLVAAELEGARTGLPNHEELEKAAAAVSNRRVREKTQEALRAADEWRHRIEATWRLVEDLPSELTYDNVRQREEPQAMFSYTRMDLTMKSEEFRTPILEAIDLINAVDRSELPDGPSPRWMFWKWGLWKRIGSRLKRRKS